MDGEVHDRIRRSNDGSSNVIGSDPHVDLDEADHGDGMDATWPEEHALDEREAVDSLRGLQETAEGPDGGSEGSDLNEKSP